MATRSSSPRLASPNNLCEMFLRDLELLLGTSRLIKRSVLVLRKPRAVSPELTKIIDTIIALCDGGEGYLNDALSEAGAVLPSLPESTTNAVIEGFISAVPVTLAPAVFAAEVIANLRLLVQHFELKAVLAAEAALLVGQTRLSRALLKWSAEWRNFGEILRSVTVRVRAQAYVADLNPAAAPQFA